MIATWIQHTTNGACSFVVFLVMESRMSGGPSPSHVTEATQEMPRKPRWFNSSAACFCCAQAASCNRQVWQAKRSETIVMETNDFPLTAGHAAFKDQREAGSDFLNAS